MLDAVADLLACPVCHSAVLLDDRTLRCAGGHRFDVARQGYVNLLTTAQPRNADTAAMVQARLDFLATGHYDTLCDALPVNADDEVIVDAGSGPGHYLAHVLDRAPRACGVACDLAVAACRRAARAHPRTAAVTADTWSGLPLRSQVADTVLVIFAPRNFAEFARVLRPGGRLVVVTPGRDHLEQVRTGLGLLGMQQHKADRIRRDASAWFEPVRHRQLREAAVLSRTDVINLVGMGPNAFHTDPKQVAERAGALAPIETTISFDVAEFVVH